MHSFTTPVLVGHTLFPLRAPPGQALRLSVPPPAPGSPSFVLLDGPPYANGPIHLGHAYNKHLKDMVVRANAETGADTAWRPGWDCHGLPVELCVEREGADRRDPLAFVAHARTYANTQVARQKASFEALGLAADWEHPYRTMDPQHQAGTMRTFAELLERNLVRVAHRPGPWCPACRSTLAAAEQEEKTVTVETALAPFALDDGGFLVAWTTTPWTLPYHAGLAVHPDATYVRWERDGATMWAAEAAEAHVRAWWPDAEQTDDRTTGTALAGQTYTGATGVRGTVVADGRVSAEAGTGVLHAVPAFSVEDAQLGRTHRWPVVDVLAADGRLNDAGWEAHRGLRAGPEASAPVLVSMAGTPWFRTVAHAQTVPTCWRHKTPLLTRPSRQVFLDLDAVRPAALAALDGVVFEPPAARERLRHAVASRPDWCLSRQRVWGVPLALYLDKETGLPCANAAAVVRRVADAVAQDGVEAWWREPDERWLDGLETPETVTRVNDVLDVWFDSGAVAAVLGVSADAVVEGHDQVRGWFQSALWVSAALGLGSPFRHVLVHGFVVGPDGRKLSKSEGGDSKVSGVPAWGTLPTDLVRVWAAQGEMGQDRPWSAAALTQAEGALHRWRGCVRFALANTPSQDWGEPVDPTQWFALDRADARAMHEAAEEALEELRAGRPQRAATRMLGAAETALSQGLFMRLKDRLYCAGERSTERRAAVEALRTAVGSLVRVLRVLTPALVAEAEANNGRPLLPTPATLGATSNGENEAVGEALRWRATLTKAWELQAVRSKGGLSRARVVGLNAVRPTGWCDEAWMEALGVGQLGDAVWPGAEACSDERDHAFWLGPSPDPLCPRCRQPAVAWPEEDGQCGRCTERTAVA